MITIATKHQPVHNEQVQMNVSVYIDGKCMQEVCVHYIKTWWSMLSAPG